MDAKTLNVFLSKNQYIKNRECLSLRKEEVECEGEKIKVQFEQFKNNLLEDFKEFKSNFFHGINSIKNNFLNFTSNGTKNQYLTITRK